MARKYRRVPLTKNSICSTLFASFYAEQLPDGEEVFFSAIRNAGEEYQIFGIKHYKSKTNKPHYHVCLRFPSNSKTSVVETLLDMLHIHFRDGIDDAFLHRKDNPPLETCGGFADAVTYLMHTTPEARQLGKEPYDKSDIVTNMSEEDLDKVLSGYTPSKKKITTKSRPIILDMTREAGLKLKPYYKFVDSLGILGLTPTDEKRMKNAYEAGLQERILKNKYVDRIAIEIEYPKNASSGEKSRINNAIESACHGYRYACFDNELGNFDAMTEAIIIKNINSNIDSSLLNKLCSTQINSISIKGKQKPVFWCGRLFIFTHDQIPSTNQDGASKEHKLSSLSFLCSVTENGLRCTETSSYSFTDYGKEVYKALFIKIRDLFNEEYRRSNATHYSTLSADELNE